MNRYLVELTQQQKIVVEILAEDSDEAVQQAHAQCGQAESYLPPEIVESCTRILREEAGDE